MRLLPAFSVLAPARLPSTLGVRGLALPLLLLPALAAAQIDPEPADTLPHPMAELAPLVVTAAGSEVDLRNAPASISVIQRSELDRRPVQSLGEVLAQLPGVSGGLSPTGSMAKISLRGLPENYTLLLVDGQRIGSSRDTNYRPDLGRQDLNWVAPESIERIEIVRGPMSALYGSDAMGGVINIITRPVTPNWRGSVTTSYTLPEERARGDAYQLSYTLSGPLGARVGLKMGAGYSRQNSDEVDLGGVDDALGASGVRDANAHGEVVWSPTGSHVVRVGGSYGVQEGLAPKTPNAEGEVQSAWGAAQLTRADVRVGHRATWAFGTTRLDVHRNAYDNDQGEGVKASSGDWTIEGVVNVAAVLGVPHAFTLGAQYRREEITNTRTIGTIPVDYEGRAVEGSSLAGSTAAVFAEDQVALSPTVHFTAGARVDHHHERYGAHLTPRAYLVYHPAAEWTVRGGVSRGFRAPTLKENSAGAATFSRGRGCGSLEALGYTGDGCTMAGNPDLAPEESTNWEAGLSLDRGAITLGATWFHTTFRNKIEYAPLGFFEGVWWTRMENVERARTSGVEATATLPLGSRLVWRTHGTWMIEARNLDTGASLITTPEYSASSSMDWRVAPPFDLSASARYTGTQLGAGSTITAPYTLVDGSARWTVSDRLSARFGATNLFGTEISTDSGHGYYQPGRRFFLSLTSAF